MNQRWDQRPKICWAEWACNFLVERAKEKAARFLPNGECRGRSPSIRKQLAGNETRIYSKPIPPLLEVLKWLKYCFIPLYFSANSPGVHHSSSPCRKVPNFAKILKVDAHITSPLSHKRSDSLCSWFLDFPIKNCHPLTPFYYVILTCLLLGIPFHMLGTKEKNPETGAGKLEEH